MRDPSERLRDILEAIDVSNATWPVVERRSRAADIDHRVVREAVERDIPELKRQVEALPRELEGAQ